jgi:hypothetical protein
MPVNQTPDYGASNRRAGHYLYVLCCASDVALGHHRWITNVLALPQPHLALKVALGLARRQGWIEQEMLDIIDFTARGLAPQIDRSALDVQGMAEMCSAYMIRQH